MASDDVSGRYVKGLISEPEDQIAVDEEDVLFLLGMDVHRHTGAGRCDMDEADQRPAAHFRGDLQIRSIPKNEMRFPDPAGACMDRTCI
ncbi:MAG TPA: hypothetical protein VMJ65_16070 [Solirubrobacteraceae bacterium]|nr:hypothetical protein [Solirubrobacteraceae bacterium]